jgi:hypothetical protein
MCAGCHLFHPGLRPIQIFASLWSSGELRTMWITLQHLSADSPTRYSFPSPPQPFYSRSSLWVFSRLHVYTTWLFGFPIRQFCSTFFNSCAHPAVIFNASFHEEVGCHSTVSFRLWRGCFLFDFGLSRENFKKGGVTVDSSRVAVLAVSRNSMDSFLFTISTLCFPSFLFHRFPVLLPPC